MSGSKEKITFNGLYSSSSSYYQIGYYTHGAYDGMIWTDVFSFEKEQIQKAEHVLGWCDNGYINDLHGQGEAFMPGFDYIQSYGGTETFKLKSADLAAAWEGTQNLDVNTYKGGVLKGSETITVSQTGGHYSFHGAMFKGITGVAFVYAGGATGGSTCTYGSPTYAPQMVIDNIKVVFNGGIPAYHSAPKSHHPHIAAALAGVHGANGHVDSVAHSDTGFHSSGHVDNSYHSQLMSLPVHDPGGLTSQFHIPAVQHFGS
jgi:hypothetical protein